MLPAKDVMTKNVFRVQPETPIDEALNILLENRVSGLPVVDQGNLLVGVITEKDLLNLLVDGRAGEGGTVADYMSGNVTSFEEDDNIVLICEFFIKNNFRRVPIVKDGQLMGVISRRDIIKLVYEERNKSEEE